MGRPVQLPASENAALRQDIAAALARNAITRRQLVSLSGLSLHRINRFLSGERDASRTVADGLRRALRAVGADGDAPTAARAAGAAFDPARHDLRAAVVVLDAAVRLGPKDGRLPDFCRALFDAWSPAVASAEELVVAALLARKP